MQAEIVHPKEKDEFPTSEGCFILEVWNKEDDPDVSIARAKVPSKIKTQSHSLAGVSERYLIFSGSGVVHIEGMEPEKVGPGDSVFIPPNTVQWIENTASNDLIFYCIWNPRFANETYKNRSNR